MKNETKNLLKNGYLFLLKLFRKKGFVVDLKNVVDKWPSSFQKNQIGYAWDFRELSTVKLKNAKAYKQRLKFIEKLEKTGKILDFQNDIRSFIKKHELGSEWFLPITDYVISFWLHPPHYNLSIRENKKRVMLVLNPDTSIDDIKDAWKIIKEKQEKLWPDFKKTNLTKKSFKNLYIAIEDLERKMNDKIGQDNVRKQTYKLTDLDAAGKIWENEEDISESADKKRAANLRQIRKRYKLKKM